MSFKDTGYPELMERKIGLLQQLAVALWSAKAALAACDIDALEIGIRTQIELCGELRSLDRDLNLFVTGQAVCPVPEESRKAFLHRLREAGAEAKQRNAEFRIVLERSRRTVTALINAMRTFEGNYVMAVQRTPVNAGMQGRV